MSRFLHIAGCAALFSMMVCAAFPAVAEPVETSDPAVLAQPSAEAPPLLTEEEAKLAAEEARAQRIEWLPFPVIGGNTDMGILVGAQITLVKFDKAYLPYRFRTHTQVSLSFKDGPDGVEMPVHMDFVKLDFPGLAGGKLRLLIGLHYDQVNNSGYFGIGNAAHAVRAYFDPERGQVVAPASDMYKYVRQEPKLRVFLRYNLVKNLDLALGLRFMWMNVTTFAGSKLEQDLPTLKGTDPHFGLQFSAGIIYDTRDHEYNPSKGIYLETALRFQPGLGNDLHFGAYSLDARFFVPLMGETLVFASRWMLDMMFGNVPFYEMARGGAFDPIEFIGGRMGLSGIPEGRYHGKVKVGANLELRSVLWPFTLWKQNFKIGMAMFCNVGRVWADYSGNTALDGTGVGMKVAVGGGLRIQFNETTIVRIDVAWADEAKDAGSPVGIYLDAYHPF